MSVSKHQKQILLLMGEDYTERVHYGVAEYAGQQHWHLNNLLGVDPRIIEQRECDGIIAVLNNNDILSSTIIRKRVPCVGLSIDRQTKKIPLLTGNNREMGQDAATHFMERGFKNFIWFSEDNHPTANERYLGFRSALRENQYDCLSLILRDEFPEGTAPWNIFCDWLYTAITNASLPCAIYAYNDVQAGNLISACTSMGITVPDDIAIMGTDNNPLICPTAAVPLSSIHNDLEELGRRAAEELDKILKGATMRHRIIEIPHKGINVRQSSDIYAINDNAVVSALRFINKNYQRSIEVAEITKASGITRRSLERRFQKYLKTSVLTQLNKRRFKNVCQLLEQSDISIADIASSSGFNTPEYLHRVFLKTFSMTPRRYRIQSKIQIRKT